MKNLKLKDVDLLYKPDFPLDVATLVRLFEEAGYSVPAWFAQQIWELYSEQTCAGWLYIPDTVAGLKACLSDFIDWE